MAAMILESTTASPTEAAADGSIVINGVRLSHIVAEELRKLGISASWYEPYLLEKAVRACAFDSRLIDDPDGMTLEDQMELTDEEELEYEDEAETQPYRRNMMEVRPPAEETDFFHVNFLDRLLWGRKKARRLIPDNDHDSAPCLYSSA